MDVLWVSDSPDVPSGFGTVTRYVCGGLARLGHQVTILGWHATEPFACRGCLVRPVRRHPLGADVLAEEVARVRPDVVVTLGDVSWLAFMTSPEVRGEMERRDVPWVLYFPIDGETAEGTLPVSWTQLLHEVDVPVAMSRYGEGVARASGVRCAYIPHGVDIERFSPPPDRDVAKRRVGADGRFVVLSDSRNQPRKLLPRVLDVFSRFAESRPDALLHLHTDPDEEWARSDRYSYDVRADVRHLGLERQVRFTPAFRMARGGGLAVDDLARYYQAADVHLLASTGEGFGLPSLQAAATGVVPMAGAYSASHELVAGHGEAIAIEARIEGAFGILRAFVDVDDAVRKLSAYYDDRARLVERSVLCRRFAEPYAWSRVLDRWVGLLRSIGEGPGRIGRARRGRPFRPSVAHGVVRTRAGATVRVKTVRSVNRRITSSLAADAEGGSAEPRIPPAGELGMAWPDVAVYVALRRIFPALAGWVLCPLDGGYAERDGLDFVPPDALQIETRLRRTVALVNVSGALPARLVAAAAALGVPCVGTGSGDLVTVVQACRELLTSPPSRRRASGAPRPARPSSAADRQPTLLRTGPGVE
ncbi:MAG: glycosyltransferase family 4 protein [Actinomycetota bacterium]|nr:glycosyltransferase family 4 protein [Actinomycetota bacterium]